MWFTPDYVTLPEFGWFQTRSSNEALGIRSRAVNMSYFMGVCHDLFGIDQVPDAYAVNEFYGYGTLNSCVCCGTPVDARCVVNRDIVRLRTAFGCQHVHPTCFQRGLLKRRRRSMAMGYSAIH